MDVIDARGANGVHMYHKSINDGVIYKSMQGKDIERFYDAASTELFDAYADLKHFGWQQFAFTVRDDGYFHPFSAHTHDSLLEVNGLHECDWWDSDESDAALAEALSKPIAAFLDRYNDIDLYMMFGPDAEITVSRRGIVVTDCSDCHD